MNRKRLVQFQVEFTGGGRCKNHILINVQKEDSKELVGRTVDHKYVSSVRVDKEEEIVELLKLSEVENSIETHDLETVEKIK